VVNRDSGQNPHPKISVKNYMSHEIAMEISKVRRVQTRL